MKSSRQKKILGISLGEHALTVVEILPADRPQALKMEEFLYPEGMSLSQPAELGAKLREFLAAQGFTARLASVGLPVRWLAVRQKQLPPTDAGTMIEVLRLSAETEFSSELKDLVYDFSESSAPGTVLLIATQRKNVEAAEALCEAAELKLLSVTATATALGQASAMRNADRETLVLSVGATGSELTSAQGKTVNSIRHLRAATPQPPFVSELRRIASTLPPSPGGRSVLLFGGPELDAKSLGGQLGWDIHNAALAELGVDGSASSRNGDGGRFAPAVAVGLCALQDATPAVNFLHSRLAPPVEQKYPRWMILSAIVGVLLIGFAIYSYIDLQNQEAEVADMQTKIATMQAPLAKAKDFVDRVTFAQAWHGGDPRYLACLRDLTSAMPGDGQTFSTSLHISEPSVSASTTGGKTAMGRELSAQLNGKTSDQQQVSVLVDRMQHVPGFTNVTLVGADQAGGDRIVSFYITFNYEPGAAKP